MVTLQPRIPKFRKRKEEPSEGDKEYRPQGGEGEEAAHPKPGKRGRNWKMIYGAAAMAVVVVILAVIVMVYSAPPPSAGNAVSDSEVRAELARVREISTYPENLNLNPKDYPKVFGVWNNRTLAEQYFCSDVCPDNGRVDLVFQGIVPDKCENVGGRELRDLAFGGYIGCQPGVE